jgi:acyl-ACP thioesterase
VSDGERAASEVAGAAKMSPVSELPAVELLPVPASGRRFVAGRVVRLGDVDPAGQLRLDAIAAYLQDVASDDALDAAVGNPLAWLVRRTLIRVDVAPVANEQLTLTTFCTGWGRSWAERRTTLAGDGGGLVEAVSLWVQIDVATGRPARLADDFFATWGEAAGERSVSSKLSLPSSPPEDAAVQPWSFRRADLDQFAHVNNAAVWTVVEEIVQGDGVGRTGLTAEIEYLQPADAPAAMVLVRDGGSIWLRTADRTVVAARLSRT